MEGLSRCLTPPSLAGPSRSSAAPGPGARLRPANSSHLCFQPRKKGSLEVRSQQGAATPAWGAPGRQQQQQVGKKVALPKVALSPSPSALRSSGRTRKTRKSQPRLQKRLKANGNDSSEQMKSKARRWGGGWGGNNRD